MNHHQLAQELKEIREEATRIQGILKNLAGTGAASDPGDPYKSIKTALNYPEQFPFLFKWVPVQEARGMGATGPRMIEAALQYCQEDLALGDIRLRYFEPSERPQADFAYPRPLKGCFHTKVKTIWMSTTSELNNLERAWVAAHEGRHMWQLQSQKFNMDDNEALERDAIQYANEHLTAILRKAHNHGAEYYGSWEPPVWASQSV